MNLEAIIIPKRGKDAYRNPRRTAVITEPSNKDLLQVRYAINNLFQCLCTNVGRVLQPPFLCRSGCVRRSFQTLRGSVSTHDA